jgi:hypothetical protein
LLVEGYQGLLARKDRIDVPSQYNLKLVREWLEQTNQAPGPPDIASGGEGEIRPDCAMRTGFSCSWAWYYAAN